MLNPNINIGKPKNSVLLSNLHISNMATTLKNNGDICKRIDY